MCYNLFAKLIRKINDLILSADLYSWTLLLQTLREIVRKIIFKVAEQ